MLIDTHAHVNFNAFKNDADEAIRRSLENSVWMINVGSTYKTSKRAAVFSENYSQGVYAAIGLHPIHAQDGFNYEKYKELAQLPRVAAIGETGLDYKEEYAFFKEKQKEVFLKQLELAREVNLPIILHCRMAHQELINELRIKNYELKGAVHCFSGNWQDAEKYLEMGLYLGFNGIIFKMNLDDVIKKTPLKKILIETDCPYLTPPQERGRNEPIYIKHTVERVAQIKGLTLPQVAEITTENAKKLFNI